MRPFWNASTATGADFLIRAKTGTRALKLPIMTVLGDGSYLSHAGGLTVRVIDAELALTTDAGTCTGNYRLVTTLLDPSEAPDEQLLSLYHQRWQIETAYCELKSTILGGRVLRGRISGRALVVGRRDHLRNVVDAIRNGSRVRVRPRRSRAPVPDRLPESSSESPAFGAVPPSPLPCSEHRR